jgi:hypothetical protein
MKESVYHSRSSLYQGLFENGFRSAEKGAECEIADAARTTLPALSLLRPGARRRTALRGLGWCWTDAAGWSRVAPQGCPGATASGRATGKAWGGVQPGPARRSTAGHAAQDGVGCSLRDSLARRPRDSVGTPPSLVAGAKVLIVLEYIFLFTFSRC